MISLSYLQLDLLVVFGALLPCYFYYTMKRNGKLPLPPGPKPLPIIGNMRELPTEKTYETYARWAKQYGKWHLITNLLPAFIAKVGDVIHVRSLGQSIIILNSFKAANDLLERRSSIYSSRPHLIMFHELMDFGGVTTFQPYGSIWRKHRTEFQKQMNQKAVREFQPAQVAAVKRLLRLLLESPQNYRQHVRHMAAGVVMSITYGHTIAPKGDYYVALSERNGRAFGQATRPGAYIVDIIPILKHVPAWFPGAGFKRYAQETRKGIQQVRDGPFRDVKSRLTTGTARSCFVANALTELGTTDESNEDVEIVKRLAQGMFGAGTNTTASSIYAFILAMIIYPHTQKKAQAELDSVVGRDRLPQFDDRPYLPYIDAVVKEVLRWLPVVPTALPHVTTQDDEYEGYSIPANSIVVGNAWSILHDPGMYSDPFTFRPERFLPDKDGNVEKDPAVSGAFGFGRRICAGRHLADASVWIAVASILSVFNLSDAVDENGRKMDVSYALDPCGPGFFSHTQIFTCLIKPRSKDAEEIIRRTEQN